MARKVVKFDMDAGWHPESEVDVQAVVVRWDQALKTIVIDCGGVHPSIAKDWLLAAADRLQYEVDEQLEPMLQEEL